MPRREIPEIDARTCTNCGDCVRACPADALVAGRFMPELLLQECIHCALCDVVCPVGAIAMLPPD